jgi:hypothetical protein
MTLIELLIQLTKCITKSEQIYAGIRDPRVSQKHDSPPPRHTGELNIAASPRLAVLILDSPPPRFASPSIYLKKILLGSFSVTHNNYYLLFLYISLSTVNTYK